MEDDWVTAAFSDDALVAELLCRLNQSSSQPSKPPPLLSLPLGWGHRQPRSKPKKDSSTTRCSPTTPLSWSGGSDGDYSNSNSSRPSSDLFRSKGACNNNDDDAANIYFNNKRSTKKKTFAQLKEEESLLLKERVTLKRELASLHVTLKEQRVRSEKFKRFKVGINLETSGEMICRTEVAFPTNSCNQMEASTSSDRRAHSAFPRHAALQDGFGSYSLGSHRIEKEVGMQAHKVCFALPDLNMMPSEEDIIIGPEMLNGMS